MSSAGPASDALCFGVRLIVGYDGTDFHGWQRQDGLRTVQGILTDAVREMAGVDMTEVRGASRTDAGVHAIGQVAAFGCAREIPLRGWVVGLNGRLPDDVVILRAEPCAPDYQPRFDAFRKTYRYRIHTGPRRDPFRRRDHWYLRPGFARRDLPRVDDEAFHDLGRHLDLDAMREAASRLLGRHDFHAFRAADDERESSTRTLFDVSLHRPEPSSIAIEVTGDAFMKNMVRILVGTLVEVGRRRMTPDEAEALLGPGGRREDAGPTAPAHGLTLVGMELGRLSQGRSR